jgi:succinate dehydrogenase/fumarate reductase flavoprotein subunit
LAGNALTEALVFGARAGTAAALWAGSQAPGRATPVPDEMLLPPPAGPGDGAIRGSVGLKRRLQKVLWEKGGILRNREGLLQAIEAVGRIREEALHVPLKTAPAEMHRRIELQLGSQTALLILQAALRREESRGAHFREDFPVENNGRWRGHLDVGLAGGEPRWSFKPAPALGNSNDRQGRQR